MHFVQLLKPFFPLVIINKSLLLLHQTDWKQITFILPVELLRTNPHFSVETRFKMLSRIHSSRVNVPKDSLLKYNLSSWNVSPINLSRQFNCHNCSRDKLETICHNNREHKTVKIKVVFLMQMDKTRVAIVRAASSHKLRYPQLVQTWRLHTSPEVAAQCTLTNLRKAVERLVV